MRIVPILAVLVLALAACDVRLDSDGEDSPTPIVITSTPTEAGTEPPATETGEAPRSPTAAATQPDNPEQPSPTPPPGTSPEPTATTPSQNDGTRSDIQRIEGQVQELRGLELLVDLDVQIIDRAELSRRIEEIIGEEYSPEQARIDTLSYWLLRLVPDRSLDLFQLQIDLLGEQVAGYYDPETGDLVVVTDDGRLSASDKVTLAHEIVHGLQDQHFDLLSLDEFATDSDREAAITALIEGDAVLSMTQYMLQHLDPFELLELLGESMLGEQDFDVLENAPRYISDGLYFPYEAGNDFVTTLYETGGFAAIDAALQDPPLSTEQILHPEKYFGPDRDDPIDVANPDLSNDIGSGWELVSGDVLGEWDLRIMLEENGVGARDAAAAAAGWGGSWFDIYQSGEDALALLTTRWDSDADASEFAGALLASFGGGVAFGGLWSDGERHYSVLAGGDTVVMISGTDRDAVAAVLALMEQTV